MSLNLNSNYYKSDSNINKYDRNITTEHELREKIYELKERVIDLEAENKKYLVKISELSRTKNNFLLLEKANEDLTNELASKKEVIQELKNDLLKEKKGQKEEKRELENDFHSKLIYYKRLKDTNDYKENAASSIIKLNEIQHYSIIKLENKIDEIKNFYESKLKEQELKFDKKYTNLKKNMMEFLKNAQKNMDKTSKENLELNTKLGILYKNEMLNELENQSRLIENLIKEKEKQHQEIYLLKQELAVHQKVEEMIKSKNSKFMNIINKINIKINKNKGNLSEEREKTKIYTKYENNKTKKKIKDLYKRAKSVKNFNLNHLEGNSGILENYLTGNLTNGKPKSTTNQTKSCITPKIINDKFISKGVQSERKFFEKYDGNIFNEINNKENSFDFNNIIDEIVTLCNQSLKFILNENKFSQNFKDFSFQNDINIKYDYLSLTNELKYELLMEIIKKVLNFLKTNNNIKEEKNIIKIDKKSSELLRLNDEYNFQFSRILDNENYNKMNNLKIKSQILKYDKLIKMIDINKQKCYSPDRIIPLKIKKNKIRIPKAGNNTANIFRKNTPNLIKRYIHITNKFNDSDTRNKTFLNSNY